MLVENTTAESSHQDGPFPGKSREYLKGSIRQHIANIASSNIFPPMVPMIPPKSPVKAYDHNDPFEGDVIKRRLLQTQHRKAKMTLEGQAKQRQSAMEAGNFNRDVFVV